MNIYELVDILTCFFEALMMLIILDTYCTRRENIKLWMYAVGAVGLTALILISNIVFNFGLMNAVGMSLCVFIASFMFKGNIPAKIILSATGVLLLAIVEILTMFIISAVLNVTTTVAVEDTSLRLLGIIISKMLTFAIVLFMRAIVKERELKIKPSYWILFSFIFASSHLAVFLLFTLSYNSHSTYLHGASAICSFGLLFSTGIALYLYERLSKQAEIEKQKQIFEQQLISQSKHLEEILVTQEQFRKFRHDLSNHLIVINSMFEENGCKDGIGYVNTMKSSISVSKHLIDTGNVALDAIINTKKAIAETKGIDFSVKIQVPQQMPVEANDICIIFGNALDNAIEACEKIKSGHKRISLAVVYNNNSLYCKIANSASEPSKLSLETTKADKKNHGFGIENIKTALMKYQSEPTITTENGEFVLKFIMFFR